jgi:hypothetical protein
MTPEKKLQELIKAREKAQEVVRGFTTEIKETRTKISELKHEEKLVAYGKRPQCQAYGKIYFREGRFQRNKCGLTGTYAPLQQRNGISVCWRHARMLDNGKEYCITELSQEDLRKIAPRHLIKYNFERTV